MNATRIHVGEGAEAVYAGLHRMAERAEKAALDAGLDKKLIDLIRYRTSQINGCAYCLELHTKDALSIGEDPARLAVISAWEETEWFDEVERAALELTEAVTEIASVGPMPEEQYERVLNVLGEERYAAVFWMSTVYNSYNRVAITSQYRVGPEA